MATEKTISIVASLPRYMMPDESEPEYMTLFEKLHDFRKS
jgi:hypothetical protein